MHQALLAALVETKNEAADDLLLEALRVGNESEQARVLPALYKRKTSRGLCGVVETYASLAESVQHDVMANIRIFHPALRECGRSETIETRFAAMRMIALGHQGRLAYVISENLHDTDEALSRAATEAMVAMARWVTTETRQLARRSVEAGDDPVALEAVRETYAQILENRGEIEAAVARAMDVHRGKHGAELLRAGLMLCDWPGSKTLAILTTSKHGGQSVMLRKLQQPPAAEHVDAFILAATHANLRTNFGTAFAHVAEAPVLDSFLRRTHWLKDNHFRLCMHQATRGVWLNEPELMRDIEARSPADSALIGEYIAASGLHDVMQDQRLEQLRVKAADDFGGRLRLLRIALGRKRGSSTALIKTFLNDPDERIARMAAREMIRRRPQDYENVLLQQMTNSPESVRKVIGRAIGNVGFDHFWNRFERMEKATRKSAGRAMMKLLPDAMLRLGRRLVSGPVEQQVKAIAIVQELGVAESLSKELQELCAHDSPRIRSKAVTALAEVQNVAPELIVDRVLNDVDPRVRANAIETIEARQEVKFLPVLASRARSSNARERANAIKAMGKMRVATASSHLLNMLRDERPDHKISAMWTLRQTGLWQLLKEVGRLAKEDENLRVRRYAITLLRSVIELVQAERAAAALAPVTEQRKAG